MGEAVEAMEENRDWKMVEEEGEEMEEPLIDWEEVKGDQEEVNRGTEERKEADDG